MESNDTFTANFADDASPTLTVVAPKASQSISNVAANSMWMASGTARDNVAVSNVYYQLNGGSWNTANTFNSFSNWMANLNLNEGTNKLNAYAVDTTGNHSTTSSVSFVFVVLPDWAPESVADLTDEVTPDPGFGAPFTVSFGTDTFSKTGSTTNFDDYGVGDYSYLKTGTNTAQIFRTNTAPPSVTNDITIANLIFINLNAGTVSNIINGDTGTFKFITAKTFVPASVGGKTLTATRSTGNVTAELTTNGTFVASSDLGTNSGTYTFTIPQSGGRPVATQRHQHRIGGRRRLRAVDIHFHHRRRLFHYQLRQFERSSADGHQHFHLEITGKDKRAPSFSDWRGTSFLLLRPHWGRGGQKLPAGIGSQ